MPSPSIHLHAVTTDDAGPMAEIGLIFAALNRKDKESEAVATQLLDARQDFFGQFQAICRSEVRPAMEAVLDNSERTVGTA
jgi:hypothetical protein